jgi:hypothetical protein
VCLGVGRLRTIAMSAAAALVVAGAGVFVALRADAADEPETVVAVSYAASDENVANPERGFMHFADCSRTPLAAATLETWRRDGITQVFCMIYLTEFRDRDLDDATLTLLQRQFDTVRAAGMTTILRFAYTDTEAGEDAAPARVLRHIAQLKPVLTANAYVISTLQAGFIGAWGEWYYTKNFGNAGQISAADAANRRAVVDALLDALPATRTVQLRTPGFKRSYFGTDPLTAATAYSGESRARVGHHNDCFLASPDDFGTYTDPAVERPYLAADSAYLPVGGETCAVNPPRSECASALAEMTQFHWSYLNADYQPDVLASWRTGRCMPEIQRRLGYRFVLTDGSYSASGRSVNVRFGVRNDGFSAPYNPRLAQVVLRGDDGIVTRLPLTTDPRRWAGGRVPTGAATGTLPADLPSGRYQLGLALPDATPALAADARYAIRTANTDLWVAEGYNDLKAAVTVS